jgi:glycosyltransferase involved in cell wall biosynthesis
MRVSVVVPAHNAASTLAAAVRSALDQTRPPDEVVVVDDGSTDATPTVVGELGDEVRLVTQRQSGPSAARNAGVTASSGDWLAFLDADDQWHPEKLERQLRVADDDVVLVATDWARELTGLEAPQPVPTSVITTAEILLLNRFQTSTVLLRRDAFVEAGRFDPSLDGVEDWDMWLRASRQGRVVKLDWPFVRYADVATGYSKELERVYRTGLRMLERELGNPPVGAGRSVMAWHHLRFALAYLLTRDQRAARACLAELRAAALVSAAPDAAVRYLLPFLVGRVRRRMARAPARSVGASRPGK